jgi:hypothetical protein
MIFNCTININIYLSLLAILWFLRWLKFPLSLEEFCQISSNQIRFLSLVLRIPLVRKFKIQTLGLTRSSVPNVWPWATGPLPVRVHGVANLVTTTVIRLAGAAPKQTWRFFGPPKELQMLCQLAQRKLKRHLNRNHPQFTAIPKEIATPETPQHPQATVAIAQSPRCLHRHLRLRRLPLRRTWWRTSHATQCSSPRRDFMHNMAGIVQLGPESHLVVNRLAAMNSTSSSP